MGTRLGAVDRPRRCFMDESWLPWAILDNDVTYDKDEPIVSEQTEQDEPIISEQSEQDGLVDSEQTPILTH